MSSDKKALQAIKDIGRVASRTNTDVSKRRLLQVLDKSSFSTQIVAAICLQLMDLGELVSVIDILQKSVEKNGEDEIIYNLMGQAALRLQIPDLAEKAYAQAYRLNSEEPSHLLHVAIAIEKAGPRGRSHRPDRQGLGEIPGIRQIMGCTRELCRRL